MKFCALTKRSEKEVRAYLRVRSNNMIIDRKVSKFIEATWRFLFFTFFSVVGYYCVLYPRPTVWITVSIPSVRLLTKLCLSWHYVGLRGDVGWISLSRFHR